MELLLPRWLASHNYQWLLELVLLLEHRGVGVTLRFLFCLLLKKHIRLWPTSVLVVLSRSKGVRMGPFNLGMDDIFGLARDEGITWLVSHRHSSLLGQQLHFFVDFLWLVDLMCWHCYFTTSQSGSTDVWVCVCVWKNLCVRVLWMMSRYAFMHNLNI